MKGGEKLPTETDFNAVIAPWCTKEGVTPKQFLPLRALFLQYLQDGNQIAAQGILGCIVSFEDVRALESFIPDIVFFQNLSIKMHFLRRSLCSSYLLIECTGWFSF